MERPLAADGSRWAIATPHAEATEAGAAAFGAGGNAVDAALAAAVTLAVVYPHMCGVGGDLFALVDVPDGKTVALNASGAAPAALDADTARAVGGERMPDRGALTITVPGAVSGWAALHREGATLSFDRAFAAAVGLARGGVPAARSLAARLAASPELAEDPGMASVFFPADRPLAEGEPLVQSALADTLEAVASGGPDALYRGEVGDRLVGGLQGAGSPMGPADLAGHRVELDSPLTAPYRDLHVGVVPPNSQGFVLLEILLAVERLGLDPDPLGADAAVLAAVFAAASADRDRHNADPRHARVPLGTLLDDGHIAALCDVVRGIAGVGAPPVARTPGPTGSGDTVAVVAADADGWAVSLIQSLYSGFGSGILEPSTGIVAHNRGACFSLDPDSPNLLAGGKRPAHTLMPVLVHQDGRLAAVSGTMGGGAQPQINALSLIRAFDLGLEPAAALAAPRWLVGGLEVDGSARLVEAEEGVPERVARAMAEAGFHMRRLADLDQGVGHAHLIVATDNRFRAAADPRSDGAALAG